MSPEERKKLGHLTVLLSSEGWEDVRKKAERSIGDAIKVMAKKDTEDRDRAWAAAQYAAAREFIEWPERERARLLVKLNQGDE